MAKPKKHRHKWFAVDVKSAIKPGGQTDVYMVEQCECGAVRERLIKN